MWFVVALQFLVAYFVVVAVAVVTPSAEPALVAVVESLTFEFVVLVGPDGQSRVPGVVGWPDVAAAAFAAIAAATVVAAAAVVFVDIAAVGSVAGTATAVAEVVDGPELELEELELLELFESE